MEIRQWNDVGAPSAILVTWLSGSPAYQGQVTVGGFIGQGFSPVTPSPRYVWRGDGTVWDSRLELVLLADASCPDLAGTDVDGKAFWADANAAAAALADGICGLTDGSSPGEWRLLSKEEWELAIADAVAMGCTNSGPGTAPSLTNDHGMNCQSAGPSLLIGVPSLSFWSATEAVAGEAWFAGLLLGQVSPSAKNLKRFVWPARSSR